MSFSSQGRTGPLRRDRCTVCRRGRRGSSHCSRTCCLPKGRVPIVAAELVRRPSKSGPWDPGRTLLCCGLSHLHRQTNLQLATANFWWCASRRSCSLSCCCSNSRIPSPDESGASSPLFTSLTRINVQNKNNLMRDTCSQYTRTLTVKGQDAVGVR